MTKDPSIRFRSLRGQLISKAGFIEDRLRDNAARNGYGNLTPALTRLFTMMGRKPIGLSQLSQRLQISRQAVHKLCTQAVQIGLIRLVPDEQDARVKLATFTEEGRTMFRTAEREIAQIEESIRARIGDEDYAALKRILDLDWDKPDS